MRALAAALLVGLVLTLTLGAAAPPDRSGFIRVGTAAMRLAPGIDHVITFSPTDAIGFDIEGEGIHYAYLAMFNGSGDYYRVDVFADVGLVNVPWSIRWVTHGPAEVIFSWPSGSDCADWLCGAAP